jgi:hypothetical protein
MNGRASGRLTPRQHDALAVVRDYAARHGGRLPGAAALGDLMGIRPQTADGLLL